MKKNIAADMIDLAIGASIMGATTSIVNQAEGLPSSLKTATNSMIGLGLVKKAGDMLK